MVVSQIEPWAADQMQGLRVDPRRRRVLAWMASRMALSAGRSISSIVGESGRKSATRIFSSMSTTLLEGHVLSTKALCQAHERVIVALDTTDLNFSGHTHTEGLGHLGGGGLGGANRLGVLGLCLHSALAVSWQGEPLGLLHQLFWAPRANAKEARKVTLEQGESFKWMASMRAVAALGLSGKGIVVADREADLYEMFLEAHKLLLPCVVRCRNMRRKLPLIEEQGQTQVSVATFLPHLQDLGELELDLEAQGGGKVRVMVSASPITMPAPSKIMRASEKDPAKRVSIPMYLVRTRLASLPPKKALQPPARLAKHPERNPKECEWVLFTSMPVGSFMDAAQVVGCYQRRWVIERFHNVLKQGVKAERLQFDELSRLKGALSLCSIVAVRLLRLTLGARARPDESPSEVLEKEFIEVIEIWGKGPVKTLSDLVRAIARLGGHLGKGPPGPLPLWHGMMRLGMMVEGFRLAKNHIQSLSHD